ncbi:MAG: helix-turn-helix domain-containing protein [Fluviicola sp.]
MNTQYNNSNTSPQDFIQQFINQTNQSIFLTGKAGTGKTTLLREIVETTHKRTVIVAPTGIAALNAGGVTIHSFFLLPFGGFIPDFVQQSQLNYGAKFESRSTLSRHASFNKVKQNLMRNLELLIIDEVSMLRADLLDAIDWTLRNVRKNNKPFGGVQVLFIGDLLQLPPVIKNEEWSVLSRYYAGIFFFNAHVIHEAPPLYIELEKIYRQDDETFISILNNLRNNRISESDKATLNKYVNPTFDTSKNEGYITLTTHNVKADRINELALANLKEKSYQYEADIKGEFPPHLFPLEANLTLKKGAQVIFIKNDISFEKNFYNGKMGRIQSLSNDEIEVFFPDEKKTIVVDKYEWTNIKYKLNEGTGEIEEEVIGTFVHYPIKLAWAITVHKSQGLTFEKAVLDVSDVFAPGQAYVALSRLKSLKGLVLKSSFQLNGLSNDESVVRFSDNKSSFDQLDSALKIQRKNYLYTELSKCYDWYDYQTKWSMFELQSRKKVGKIKDVSADAWILAQTQITQNAHETTKKFVGQLNTIFLQENLDWDHLHSRIEAAYLHFYEVLDKQVYILLKHKAEIGKSKGNKGYLEELDEIIELAVSHIQQMRRTKELVTTLTTGKELNKFSFSREDSLIYLQGKIAKIQHEIRSTKTTLYDEDDVETEIMFKSLKAKKEKEKKPEKKDTYTQTLELIKKGMTLEEVAKERLFALTTIEGHVARLIMDEKIDVSEVMSLERLSEIEDLVGEIEGKSLTELKEKCENKVSYGELKILQASKML